MKPTNANRPSETRRTFLRLLRYAKPIRWWLALACLLAMVVIGCALAGPKLLGGLIQILYDRWDLRLSGGKAAEPLWQVLGPGLLLLLAVYGVHSLFSYLKMLLMNSVVSRYFTCNLRIMISD